MSDHILKTIEQIREEVTKVEETLRPKKLLANQLCEMAGIPPAFTGIEDPAASAGRAAIRRNAFYGRPLSTCIREVLEMRASMNVREATLDEIFEALREGGYDLKSSGDREEDQKRGVAIALGKNSQTFHRLPTGDFGLTAWYPNVKEKKIKLPERPARVITLTEEQEAEAERQSKPPQPTEDEIAQAQSEAEEEQLKGRA